MASTHSIDLTQPNEMSPSSIFSLNKRKPITWMQNISASRSGISVYPPRQMSLFGYDDAELQTGRKIYLHCWGGIGRTGTTVGCYLVRSGKTGEEALRQLAEWLENVPKSYYHHVSPETMNKWSSSAIWLA